MDPQQPLGVVVGLDLQERGMRLAFLANDVVLLPWNLPFRKQFSFFRTLRAFERFWTPLLGEYDPRPVIAVKDVADLDLLLWLQNRNGRILELNPHDLQPFLNEAGELDVPKPYRRAYALASCAATKLWAPFHLYHIGQTLNELNWALRSMEREIGRISAACEPR